MLVYIQVTVGVHHIGVYTDYSWSSPYWCIYRLQLEFTILCIYRLQITFTVHPIGVYADQWCIKYIKGCLNWNRVIHCRRSLMIQDD